MTSKEPPVPQWDLTFFQPQADHWDAHVQTLKQHTQNFRTNYKTRIAALNPHQLKHAFTELAQIHSAVIRLGTHAGLLYVRDMHAQISAQLTFFELELARIDPTRLPYSDELAPYRHYIQKTIQTARFNLSEEAEEILIQKNTTGCAAFQNLYDELFAEFNFEAETQSAQQRLTKQDAMNARHANDRPFRQRINHNFLNALKQQKTIFTHIYNSIITDHNADSRRRGYTGTLHMRNTENQIAPEITETMLTTIEKNYQVARQYYQFKQETLKIHDFNTADLHAPLGAVQNYTFAQARDLITETFTKFNTEAGKIVADLFHTGHVDAAPRPNKQPGSHCHAPAPDIDAYISTHFNGDLESLCNLTHELGHALHHQLTIRNNPPPAGFFNFEPSLLLSETTSLFFEHLLHELLIEKTTNKDEQRALLCSRMEGMLNAVFRQTVYTRFEQTIFHEADSGFITAERIAEIWLIENDKFYGKTVAMTENYEWLWITAPHFVHAPFYCHAYVFGQTLAAALLHEYTKRHENFSEAFLNLLSKGGTDTPANLVQTTLDLNIASSNLWTNAIYFMEERLKNIGKILI